MAQTMFGGLDPALVQQAIQQEQQKSLMTQAQMDPAAYLRYSSGLQGQMLGQGVGELFGIAQQDPRLKMARDAQEAYSTAVSEVGNATSSEFFQKFADLAAKKNLPTLAQQAAQQASALAKSELDIRKSALSQVQELQLRQELSDLGPNATEDQVLAVVTKYGSPDKIMAALASKQAKEATRQQQKDIAEQRLDIQKQNLEFRRELQQTKVDAQTEKQAQAAQLAISNATRVIDTVNQAEKLVSPFTTGAFGVLAILPSSDARKLQNTISTIKANLGFDRLQQMRDASPTGGALGNVALKEIDFLQSTIATLDQLESPTDIRAALNKIKEHYSNWKTALEGKVPPKYQTGGGQAAIPTASAVAPITPVAVPPGVVVTRTGD